MERFDSEDEARNEIETVVKRFREQGAHEVAAAMEEIAFSDQYRTVSICGEQHTGERPLYAARFLILDPSQPQFYKKIDAGFDVHRAMARRKRQTVPGYLQQALDQLGIKHPKYNGEEIAAINIMAAAQAVKDQELITLTALFVYRNETTGAEELIIVQPKAYENMDLLHSFREVAIESGSSLLPIEDMEAAVKQLSPKLRGTWATTISTILLAHSTSY